MRSDIHVGTVRSFDATTKVAKMVIPALYGGTLIDVKPLVVTDAAVSSLPNLAPGSQAAVFFDGGTDQGGPLYFTGSSAEEARVARWNSSWGTIAKGSFIVDGQWATVNDTYITNPLTVKMLAGRRYEIEIMVRALGSDGSGASANIVFYKNGATFEPGNHFGWWRWYANWDTRYMTKEYIPQNDEENTFTARVMNHSGASSSMWFNGPSYFIVRDCGPAVQAAIAPVAAGPSYVTPGNALGRVANGTPMPNPVNTNSGSTYDVTVPLSFYAAAGRRYRLHCNIRAISAGNIRFHVTDNGAVSMAGVDRWTSQPGSYGNVHLNWGFDGDNLMHSFIVRADNASAAIALYPSEYWIEDEGPNVYPALPLPAEAMDPLFSDIVLQPLWAASTPPSHPQIRRIGDVVEMRGQMYWAFVGATNPMSWLNPIYWPKRREVNFPLLVMENGGQPLTAHGPMRLTIGTNGALQIMGLTTQVCHFTLDNVRYSVLG